MKVLKMIAVFVVSALACLALVIALLVRFYPSFGGYATESDKNRFKNSRQYQEGVFVNAHDLNWDMGFTTFLSVLRDFLKNDPSRRPKQDIATDKIEVAALAHKDTDLVRLTWLGHSAFLLEMEGKNILLDPMLTAVAAPFSFLGSKRYSKTPPLSLDALPPIDMVVLSHDHYDHLDYASILALKDKTSAFYVPLGVGVHLKAWGVSESKIHEMDWWEEATFHGLDFVCLPAQHFSGRRLGDRGATLWASWAIKSERANIYFSGDGGYADHFQEIGEKYGPFDLALLECGQYNKRWHPIHMLPEETAQAALDVQAQLMMPIHWGAFTLALHPWKEPIERVIRAAEKIQMPIITPRIGEPFVLGQAPYAQQKWWERF